MIVGPAMPTPRMLSMGGALASAISSWSKISSTKVSPWPPYSLGHVNPMSPAPCTVCCSLRAGSRLRGSPPRLNDRLLPPARVGALPGGGVTRMCWSPPYEQARAWLLGEAKTAGLATWVDPAGNVFGGLGADRVSPDAPVVL